MRVLFLFVLWALSFPAGAQQISSPYSKFGRIGAEDLRRTIYSIDSTASAVVLGDFGRSAIEGNSKGWFSLSFKRHRVVHILSKKGYEEADVEIVLHKDGDYEEKLEGVKAVTYNLENGRVVESKLDKGSVYKEKRNENLVISKFTFPNVREGSIIEFEYTVTSDFIQNIDPWYFQDASPVLWSEYEFSVPQFFSYAFIGHGYQPFYKNERKDRSGNFTVLNPKGTATTERFSFTSGVSDFKWIMKDVPELRPENFSSAIKNHISSIEFQLASQGDPLEHRDYRNTWPALTKNLMEADYFGGELNKNNNWLGDELKPLTAGSVSNLETAQKIYRYVRDHFTCTSYHAFSLSQSLRNVHRTKKGNVAELNLLLTAMLRYAGLKAEPVILSTTDHGYVLSDYPMITYFNYVIARLEEGTRMFYLDASHPFLGFGKLLPDAYNGHARIVNEEATAISLPADSLQERSVTAVFITNDEKGKWLGNMKQTKGYSESYRIRNTVAESGQENLFREIQKQFGLDIQIKEPGIDSLLRYEEPLALRYQFELEPFDEDIVYINPMFGDGYRDNPFKSAQRYFPVEMPYTIDETYVLTMEVPAGYEVDELPKQLMAKLDNQESASFEYRIAQSDNTISLRSVLKISRAFFMPEEYQTLREFFNLVVKKQSEQIVFKKIKK